MQHLILRAGLSWAGGFGRYVDLAAGWCLIIVGIGLRSPALLGFGALSLFTFAIDLGGMINRFILRWALSRKAKKG
ncbi:MAG: hypothetical protein CL949_00460 [Erythrobacter sp.]|nr:hypothetical protein [Erythrobacter sp.]|tara:strand:- start:370 stop:597 length:228 start_codon:yes stop_codon:yes gene_type:complete